MAFSKRMLSIDASDSKTRLRREGAKYLETKMERDQRCAPFIH